MEAPYKIRVNESSLQLLQKKLELVVFPDELNNVGWDYGVPLSDLKRLVRRWQEGYNWRKSEDALNRELPQFVRGIEVDGFGQLMIHYVHKKSDVENAIPLLFVHGWPGSFLEARKILPLLVQDGGKDHPSFHVVAISLPGFGFSEAPKEKGFSIHQYAEAGHKLMVSLGYEEYVTQGGDWGFHITRAIACKYGGTHSKAWHTNFPLPKRPAEQKAELSDKDKARMKRTTDFLATGTGYEKEQTTKPQTAGYALADSPVALLAWIYEKLVGWTDSYPWEDDEVLEWISIYHFSTAGPAASLRIYYETFEGGHLDSYYEHTDKIPLGLSYFPKEIYTLPLSWMPATGKLVFESEHESGGHFAAHEKPKELVGDLRRMFGKDGKAFGVVSGKNGYRDPEGGTSKI